MAKLATMFFLQIALVSATLSAQTDSWSWSYSGVSGPYTAAASGTFTTTVENGSQIVTDVTGIWNGVGITGVLPAYVYYNDNVLTAAAPYVDSNGIAFSTADNHWVSLWSSSGETYEWVSPAGNIDALQASSTVGLTVTPNEAPWEPADGVALAGIALFAVQQVRKRSRNMRPVR